MVEMQISTTLVAPGDAPRAHATDHTFDVAVVIDVLRATSVMATAFARGAERIVTCREIDHARELASMMVPRALLCGERGCKPIEGFDLGNSPAEYDQTRVGGRSLVLTTTNGTRAVETTAAANLITASFLNLSGVIDLLRSASRVHLVCAGTDGAVTAEDVLLAGAIIASCETRFGATVADDDSILARQLWCSWFGSPDNSGPDPLPAPAGLSARLRETQGGRNLIRAGYDSDIEFCALIDSCDVIPTLIARDPATFALRAI